MGPSVLTRLDSCIAEFDAALRTVMAPVTEVRRANPASQIAEVVLSETERDLAARLMRVNHSGEIAAQALYRGQALVTRDRQLRSELLRAAQEEQDHLAWCAERAGELGAGASALAPIWYLGSLLIGSAAGLIGDRASLGFLAETERQVTEHLDGHLLRLPEHDQRSRAIVERMRDDEMAHQSRALKRGAVALPAPIRLGMRLTARIMTTVSHHL